MVPVSAGRQRPCRRSLWLRICLVLVRVAVWSVRTIARRRGGVIGGRLLMVLVPGAARILAEGRHITLVSGTNGKSTTTAMLTAVLRTRGSCHTNVDGANTRAGIVSTLMESDVGPLVLETDEGWLPWAIAELRPACVVLLNLSRDQLHRHPEVRGLAASWREPLRTVPLVVANADDPAVVWAASAAREQVWVSGGSNWQQDSAACPSCGRILGRSSAGWHCACGLRCPQTDWGIADGAVLHGGEPLPLRLMLPGRANLSNAAMALAAATAAGVSLQSSVGALGAVNEVSGRYGRFHLNGQDIRLLLAKNPASWLEAIAIGGASTAPLVVALNAEGVDGRDPSWIYDVDMAAVRGRPISVCGRRGTDMAVRLELAGLGAVNQYGSLGGALRGFPDGGVDVIANYTAFRDALTVLRRAER